MPLWQCKTLNHAAVVNDYITKKPLVNRSVLLKARRRKDCSAHWFVVAMQTKHMNMQDLVQAIQVSPQPELFTLENGTMLNHFIWHVLLITHEMQRHPKSARARWRNVGPQEEQGACTALQGPRHDPDVTSAHCIRTHFRLQPMHLFDSQENCLNLQCIFSLFITVHCLHQQLPYRFAGPGASD